MEAVATDTRFLTSIIQPSTEPNSRKKSETQPAHARGHRIDSVRDSRILFAALGGVSITNRLSQFVFFPLPTFGPSNSRRMRKISFPSRIIVASTLVRCVYVGARNHIYFSVRASGIRLSLAPLKFKSKTGPFCRICRLLPFCFFATTVKSARYGGSVWESNPNYRLLTHGE